MRKLEIGEEIAIIIAGLTLACYVSIEHWALIISAKQALFNWNDAYKTHGLVRALKHALVGLVGGFCMLMMLRFIKYLIVPAELSDADEALQQMLDEELPPK